MRGIVKALDELVKAGDALIDTLTEEQKEMFEDYMNTDGRTYAGNLIFEETNPEAVKYHSSGFLLLAHKRMQRIAVRIGRRSQAGSEPYSNSSRRRPLLI